MQNGQTPLHSAARYDHDSITRLLLEVGADVMASAKVCSRVSIGIHLNDIGYSHYGKQSICFGKLCFSVC